MAAKRRVETHVPGDTEVIAAPSSSSSPTKTTANNATKRVTLASLAGDIAEMKLEIGVLVDWVRALENALAGED